MARVNQLDKRSGITYVYDSTSYWDKEKKQPRSKRTLIGRLDPVTGKIVPTDGRGKKRNQKEVDMRYAAGRRKHLSDLPFPSRTEPVYSSAPAKSVMVTFPWPSSPAISSCVRFTCPSLVYAQELSP